MANIQSAKKRIRQTAKRTLRNKSRLNRTRTFVRAVEEAIAGGDKAAAEAAFKLAQPEIVKSAQRGPVPKKTASRKVSRLAQRIKAMA